MFIPGLPLYSFVYISRCLFTIRAYPVTGLSLASAVREYPRSPVVSVRVSEIRVYGMLCLEKSFNFSRIRRFSPTIPDAVARSVSLTRVTGQKVRV